MHLKLSGQVAAGPNRNGLGPGARLLPVERPFRLVCPKYSATRHQRKMYRQPGERRREREGTPRRFMPRGLPASLVNRRNRPLRAIRPSVRPSTSMELSDGPVKNPFFSGDLNARSRSTATRVAEIDNARI